VGFEPTVAVTLRLISNPLAHFPKPFVLSGLFASRIPLCLFCLTLRAIEAP
jgi:hypothetical protein